MKTCINCDLSKSNDMYYSRVRKNVVNRYKENGLLIIKKERKKLIKYIERIIKKEKGKMIKTGVL